MTRRRPPAVALGVTPPHEGAEQLGILGNPPPDLKVVVGMGSWISFPRGSAGQASIWAPVP